MELLFDFKNYEPTKTFDEVIKELEPKNINVEVDVFESIILQDIAMGDDNIKIKLSRNLTSEFTGWIRKKILAKEQIKINIRGETRCHPLNSLILMSDFSQKPIQNCNIGDKVFTINEKTNKLEIKEVLELWDNGKKEIYEITLKGNHKVYATNEHKFYTIKSLEKICGRNLVKNKKIIEYKPYIQKMSEPFWSKLNELKENDNYLALPFKIPIYKKTNYDLNEIELLGFWLGDGYMKNNGSKSSKQVVFDLSKEDKINYLNELINNTKLNYKYSRHNYAHKENIVWANGNKFQFSKKDNSSKGKDDFSKIIYDLNLNNCLAHTKFIPNKLKQSTKKELFSLLSGLFNSDGNIDKTKGVNYLSSSTQLIEDIKIILLKLGINFHEKLKKSKLKEKTFEYKSLTISDFESCNILLNNCNLTPNHKEKLKFFLNSKNKKYLKPNSNYKIGNLLFKKIKSIKKIKKEQTFDLSIKDNHNFIVNNVLSHNSGKSQIGIRILSIINKVYLELNINKIFNAEKVICANQKELRTKLNSVEFGDFFQIDENAFANVGAGSYTEMQQLKDINNIVAKENIQMVYITPQVFLPTGATTGLAYFGKDTKNWVSRFLLYSLKGTIPSLLGYVVFDVGKNFSDNGCMIYKQIGGCTNPSRTKFNDINKDYIFHSSSIDKSKLTSEHIIDTGKTCPFYNICSSFNCSYEHKKDTWIAKELKGGIGEREQEKLEVAIKLFEEMTTFNIDKGQFRLNAKNGKELKLKIKMRLPTIVNTKYTGVEVDDIIQTTLSLLDNDFLKDTCELIGQNPQEILDRIISKTEKGDRQKKEFKNSEDSQDEEIIEELKRTPKLFNDLIDYGKQLIENKNKKKSPKLQDFNDLKDENDEL